MTRRDLIHKWAVYALGLAPLWLLDCLVLNRWPVFGVSPTLLPVAVLVVAVLEGTMAGAGFGLGTGLLWALTYSGVPALAVVGMSLMGMAAGALSEGALSRSFPGCMLCTAGGLALMGLIRVVGASFIHLGELGALLSLAAGEWLYSLCCAPAVYLLFQAVYRRVGGTKLA